MDRSPSAREASVAATAHQGLSSFAPPKRAMAMSGVQFHGCGTSRLAANAKIMMIANP